MLWDVVHYTTTISCRIFANMDFMATYTTSVFCRINSFCGLRQLIDMQGGLRQSGIHDWEGDQETIISILATYS